MQDNNVEMLDRVHNMWTKKISARIERERKRLESPSMSQTELVNKAGISRGSYTANLAGDSRLSVDVLFRLAEALGKPVSYFFVEEHASENQKHPIDTPKARAFRRLMDTMKTFAADLDENEIELLEQLQKTCFEFHRLAQRKKKDANNAKRGVV